MAKYKSPEAKAYNQAYMNNYTKQHYDRITVLLPKGKKKDCQNSFSKPFWWSFWFILHRYVHLYDAKL